MDTVVGIDLGTTNSLVAVVRGGRPEVIPVDGSPLLPSVVGVDAQDRRIVGTAARNQFVAAPDRTVRSIKRQMGRPGYLARLGASEYTPEEISAFILGRLAEAAASGLGETVRRAVITVPAYFTDRQRQATMRAGELAGLEVVRLLHEPTAAALVYGLERSGVSTAMVYDLGGGTFDVSVVEVGDGVTEVRASHGNRELGGDDFDALIVEHLAAEFQRRHRLDLRQDRRAMARIAAAAERAKIALSTAPYVVVREEFLATGGRAPLHLEVELTRRSFERMIEPLLQGTLESVRAVLRESVGDASALDEVLLVGGSTYVPAVRALVAEAVGREPRQDLNPEQVVALGAAIQAAVVAGSAIDAVLVDVCPHSLGVRVVSHTGWDLDDDCFAPIIRRNTAIPVSASEFFHTFTPDQEDVEIQVYQGEDRVASRNTHLGDMLFTGLSPDPEGGRREVLVAFDYDVNGMLHVAAVDRRSGKRTEAHIHTAALTRVDVARAAKTEPAAAVPEVDALMVRLRAAGAAAGAAGAAELQALLAEAETLTRDPDPDRLSKWKEAVAEFIFVHGSEY